MPMQIYRRHKLERTTFRQLEFGQPFFVIVGSAITPSPLVKMNRREYCSVFTDGTDTPTTLPVVDTTLTVVKIPRAFYPYTGTDVTPPR